jgi:cyclopropane-fatty-acyl-phospholipid synthase
MTQFRPFYKQVQAHYDLSNDFFALFLDSSMTYSCAYFARPDMSLYEAQLAKIDLSLGKCDLPRKAESSNAAATTPATTRMKLLDIGCGWGATARRAVENFNVDVIGLTLSKEQHALIAQSVANTANRIHSATHHDVKSAAAHNTHANSLLNHIDFRLQGWEEFTEPVDRIISIGAFEHFRAERYEAFFTRAFSLLPRGGRMMLHTIVQPDINELRQRAIVVDHEAVTFGKFICKNIFPGGQLCSPQVITRHATNAGFRLAHSESLRLHYARTLDMWADNLRARREQAITITNKDTYDMYMHYLTGCAHYFRTGHNDVMQFILQK